MKSPRIRCKPIQVGLEPSRPWASWRITSPSQRCRISGISQEGMPGLGRIATLGQMGARSGASGVRLVVGRAGHGKRARERIGSGAGIMQHEANAPHCGPDFPAHLLTQRRLPAPWISRRA